MACHTIALHGTAGHPEPTTLYTACWRTCVALAAVAWQAQHAHGIKAVLPHKVGRRPHSAVLAAIIHNDHLPGEVGALPVTPPLQVAAGANRNGQAGRTLVALEPSYGKLSIHRGITVPHILSTLPQAERSEKSRGRRADWRWQQHIATHMHMHCRT